MELINFNQEMELARTSEKDSRDKELMAKIREAQERKMLQVLFQQHEKKKKWKFWG